MPTARPFRFEPGSERQSRAELGADFEQIFVSYRYYGVLFRAMYP
jgi:hypothetical protein